MSRCCYHPQRGTSTNVLFKMHTISTSDYLEYANISGHSYCPFQDQYYCRLMCVELSASASYRPALIFSNHIIMSCFINMITQILGRITGHSLKLASGPNPLPSRWAFRVIAFRLAIGTSTDQTSHWVAVTVYLGTCYMTLLWMLHLGRCQRLCKSTLMGSLVDFLFIIGDECTSCIC